MPKVQSANGVSSHKSKVLFLLILSCCILATAGRRRRILLKCIPKLCRKCDGYVHSRWRRSLPDDVSGIDMSDVIGNTGISATNEAFDIFGTKKNDQKILPGETEEVFTSALRWQPGESPDDVDDDIEDTNMDHPLKSVHVVKRSIYLPHLRRCRIRLRTRCCKMYVNPSYIGFRL
ncbi:uncharacterized protein LOC100182066 [Ciona intestinalis]